MEIMDDRLIKATEVCQLIGRGKTTLYSLIRSGTFPPPKKKWSYKASRGLLL
ncbi:AlpA family phage regulatory protein [Pseudomonas aeruginosa]|nr:AlpA family phage regulatory protein [Pseudomonas aeruginosa]